MSYVKEEDFFSSFSNSNDSLFNLIIQESWREVIKILTRDMDPWDIDLKLLSERFTTYLNVMKEKDLKIPGKIILVSAIVYRMKSDVLKDESKDDKDMINDDDFSPELAPVISDNEHIELNLRRVTLPPIRLPTKKPIRRKVTLNDLMKALDKALKPKRKVDIVEEFNIEFHDFDIGQTMEEIYDKIISYLETKDKAFFSELLPLDHTPEDKIRALQSVLHLAFEGKIYCWQDVPFDEIYISKGD